MDPEGNISLVQAQTPCTSQIICLCAIREFLLVVSRPPRARRRPDFILKVRVVQLETGFPGGSVDVRQRDVRVVEAFRFPLAGGAAARPEQVEQQAEGEQGGEGAAEQHPGAPEEGRREDTKSFTHKETLRRPSPDRMEM